VKTTPCKAEAHLRKRLRELRKKAGLTQEAFAEHAKFSYKYYQGIERGQWTNLRLRTLEKLAEGYGIELWELLRPEKPNIKKEDDS
jgi:transcriptional regulator with XRE-family HTH domain